MSQQTVLSMARIAPGADKADKGSLALDIISSRTSNISQDDSGEAVSISFLFSLPRIYIL